MHKFTFRLSRFKVLIFMLVLYVFKALKFDGRTKVIDRSGGGRGGGGGGGQLMYFGFFLCLDSFLFIFTFLPLRVLLAIGQYMINTVRGVR